MEFYYDYDIIFHNVTYVSLFYLRYVDNQMVTDHFM